MYLTDGLLTAWKLMHADWFSDCPRIAAERITLGPNRLRESHNTADSAEPHIASSWAEACTRSDPY
jgi:hypothetical protein